MGNILILKSGILADEMVVHLCVARTMFFFLSFRTSIFYIVTNISAASLKSLSSVFT